MLTRLVTAVVALTAFPALAAAQTRNVDILFVIDNSGSMFEEQIALTEAYDELFDALSEAEGGLPDVHLGVVSSNMGADPSLIPCGVDGDNGALLVGPYPNTAPCDDRPDGNFIIDLANADGTRNRNYDGSLVETLACISQLGDQGCGFEQHLGALRKALDGTVPQNAGFLRDDAVLVVIVLADEDDCSASDTAIFDPDGEQTFGPLLSYRCAQYGVTCTPALDQTPGDRSNCTPNADSEYLIDPQDIVDFLVDLKGEENVVFGLIAGNPEPVSVTQNFDGDAELLPSCQSASGNAFPAVRLLWAAQQLSRNEFSSVCNASQGSALVAIAEHTIAAMGTFTEPEPGEGDAGPGTPDAGIEPSDPDGGVTPGEGDGGGCGCAASDGERGAANAIATALLVMLVSCIALRRHRRH